MFSNNYLLMLSQITADFYTILNNLQESQSSLLTYVSWLETEVDSLTSTIETIKYANKHKNQIYEDNLLEIVNLQKENRKLKDQLEELKVANNLLLDQSVNYLLHMNTN